MKDSDMKPYWKVIEEVIMQSDIVLEILDSRMIELSRNKQLEEIINKSGRPRIVVISKADLAQRKDVEVKRKSLVDEGCEFVVSFSKKRKDSVINLLMTIKKAFHKYGKRERIDYDLKYAPREAKAEIVIGVVGYPNVGKSSLINALAHKKKAIVSSKSGTTRGIHWIKVGEGIKILDTPGVLPYEKIDEVKLGLISSWTNEKLRQPDLVAGKIIELFLKDKKRNLERFYDFKITSDNPYEVLEDLGRRKGHLKAGGEVEEMRTSQMIVKDWQSGKLRL